MQIVKAKREKVFMKSLLTGPSGCGKSMGAEELATGMYEMCGGPGIIYIGTEGDRDKLYAETKSKHGEYTFEYDLIQLEDPFTTDSYIAAIDMAIDAGYKVCIIDGLSAEWKWLNDTHDKMPGNSFTNWSKLKPKHRELLDRILSAPMHIFCCARGKDEWLLEERNGKSVPKKVGMGSQTDKDISYEMMLSLQIEQDTHLAHADKDNTGLWPETRFSVLTAKDGKALYEWCEQGAIPAPKPVIQKTKESISSDDELKKIRSEIAAICNNLVSGGKLPANEIKSIIKESTGVEMPNRIDDLAKAKELLEKLKTM